VDRVDAVDHYFVSPEVAQVLGGARELGSGRST
jgi:hypothetical protein